MKVFTISNDKLIDTENNGSIYLLQREEFQNLKLDFLDSNFVDDFTKIDTLQDSYNINISVPIEDTSNLTFQIKIYIRRDIIYIVDDSDISLEKINKIKSLSSRKKISAPICFLGVYFSYLLETQFDYLESIERKFVEIEDRALDDKIDTFYKDIIKIRKKLIDIENYYEQFEDVCLILIEDDNSFFEDVDLRYIEKFLQRLKRLDSHLKGILDYGNQVREFCQTQVDIKLNKVMKILTSVTAICLPFTLVSAWYGMNFNNMPELKNPLGYGLTFGITLVITVILVIIFWKKKYF